MDFKNRNIRMLQDFHKRGWGLHELYIFHPKDIYANNSFRTMQQHNGNESENQIPKKFRSVNTSLTQGWNLV